MNENLKEIVVILDRSGSMGVVKGDTIGGFNSFIDTQLKEFKDTPTKIKMTLVQFSDTETVVYSGKDLSEAPKLTDETYTPSGGTALNDAVGKTIQAVGSRLANTREEERPSKVLVVILTDGQENTSKMYKSDAIKSMIAHQTNVYSWDFIYLSCGLDAFADSAKIGIDIGKTLNYNKSNQTGLYSCSNTSMSRSLKGLDSSFTPQERELTK